MLQVPWNPAASFGGARREGVLEDGPGLEGGVADELDHLGAVPARYCGSAASAAWPIFRQDKFLSANTCTSVAVRTHGGWSGPE